MTSNGRSIDLLQRRGRRASKGGGRVRDATADGKRRDDKQKDDHDNEPELETQIREETAEEVELKRQLLGLLLRDLTVLAALLKKPLLVLEEEAMLRRKRPDNRKQLLGLVPVNLAVRQDCPLKRLQASDRLSRIHMRILYHSCRCN